MSGAMPLANLTTEFMGYALEWSPFQPNRMAVATAQHFGVIGAGKQYIIDLIDGQLHVIGMFDCPDGMFDCAWSESNALHLVSASGSGAVRLWDLSAQSPPRAYNEHTAEVYSVDWNLVSKDTFITGAWDNTVKLWHPDRAASLRTFTEHTGCIYSTRWSPHRADRFASTGGDGSLRIWDQNSPRAGMMIKAHDHEVLTCDWNKYNEGVIITGSVDRSIRVWDLRNQRMLHELKGHEFAVRRVKCSPHHETIVASASYDMSVRIWDFALTDRPQIHQLDHHTEFVLGLDFNLFNEGQLATCSWDNRVCVSQISGVRQ